MSDVVADLGAVLAELERYVHRVVGPREEDLIAAEARARLTALGYEVDEHAWRDGEWGRVLELRIAPKPDAVVVGLVKCPA